MQTKVDFNFILDDLSTVSLRDASRRRRLTSLSVTAIPDNDIFEFLAQLTEDVFALSQQLVPVDTGRLKASGYRRALGFNFVIGYNTEYAAYVHEIIDNYHAPPTQAKFLQDAFVKVMNGLIATYGEAIIPDFDVRLDISIENGVKLIIMRDRSETGLAGVTWRRFLGL